MAIFTANQNSGLICIWLAVPVASLLLCLLRLFLPPSPSPPLSLSLHEREADNGIRQWGPLDHSCVGVAANTSEMNAERNKESDDGYATLSRGSGGSSSSISSSYWRDKDDDSECVNDGMTQVRCSQSKTRR